MAALLEALPLFHLLTPLPGMGVRTTAAVIVAIGDGSGFRTAGHLASYAAARGTGRRRPGLGAERAGRVAAAAEETLHRVASCVGLGWAVPLAGVLSARGKWTWRCSTSTWRPRSRSARARISVRPLALFRTKKSITSQPSSEAMDDPSG
ncbi:transposase [Streptomyces sp. NBC_00365]|uniref:transposase n=1 Tax=Streptomyces sp. NBC_00365 TaxID=2975726 RepID=UPI00338F007E